MKPKRNQPDMDSAVRGSPYLPGSITPANWADKAKDFMRMSGRENGSHPVIRNRMASRRDEKPETPGQWVAWLAYLREAKIKHAFIAKHGVATMPAEWPWEFSIDADWIRPRLDQLLDAYEAECRRAVPSHADKWARQRAIQQYEHERGQSFRDACPRQDREVDPWTQRAAAEEALDRMAANPQPAPVLSDALREVLARPRGG